MMFDIIEVNYGLARIPVVVVSSTQSAGYFVDLNRDLRASMLNFQIVGG